MNSCKPAFILDSEIHALIVPPLVQSDTLYNRKKFSEDTLVYIIYTSGTEGKAKGVYASQKQILFCCNAINRRLKNSKKDRILCSLPLSFDYGLYQIFLAFLSGAELYLEKGEMLQRIPFLLRKWKITAFPTLPTVASLLTRTGLLGSADHFSLRYISFTGEVLPIPLIRKLREAVPNTNVIPMYGMTECKRVSVMPPEREDKILEGSCGLPLEGVRVWLKDCDPDTGIGELVVEGPNVMEGYWGVKDDDTGVFGVNPVTGERRVYTGDLFRIDGEGFLYFCGRRNGIMKIRGYRVSSLWIEGKIRPVQGVIDVAVAGLADEITGERAAIFIYAKDDSVREFVASAISKMPVCLHNSAVYVFHAPLPRNRNGKTDIKKLCTMAKEGII